VRLFQRQIVAGVTAVAVWLCGVVCACGGMQRHSGATAGIAAENVPACHRRHGTPAKPSPSEKGKGGDQSCGHCRAGIAIQPDGGKPAVQFTPLAHLVCIVQPVASPVSAGPRVASLWLSGDLSPPPATSLLRLHCALNT
jgi:hypothetical protein